MLPLPAEAMVRPPGLAFDSAMTSAGVLAGRSLLATITIFVLLNQMIGWSCASGSKPRSLKSVGLVVKGEQEHVNCDMTSDAEYGVDWMSIMYAVAVRLKT